MARRLSGLAILSFLMLGCSARVENAQPVPDVASAFTDGEQVAEDAKNDTGYVTSLDAAEVEFDIEGDIDAENWDQEAPLQIGQFALTYLRQNNDVYIQSLAEDYANGGDSVEWLDGDDWIPNSDRNVARHKPTHFRMRAVSGLIMHPGSRASLANRTYAPVVPVSPGTVFEDAGTKCGEPTGGIDVEQSVYWYLWAPEKRGCNAQTQELSVTVARVLPAGRAVYPEYDRLLEDGEITAAVFFGQVDHGTLSNNDWGFALIEDFETSITAAGFTKDESADGLRYERTRSNVHSVIDIYSPRDFAGLDDHAHVDNFDDAVNSHEIVVWNGHSMLGASDFWARDSIYNSDSANEYQIFLYNGCLGYEYYVNPILTGKGGWANVDIVSNALETPFLIVVQETASALGAIMGSAERGGTTSWKRILGSMNRIGGSDAIYGASGVRDNSFRPGR